jgi:uncharacterized membrane-anchored protein YjiN (DUF445 family)
MRKIKVRALSTYLRALEMAHPDIVGAHDVAATAYEHTDLTIFTDHPFNQTIEGRIKSVTHELVHHVHKIWKLEDADENTKQEKAIEEIVDDLVTRPEWCISVVYWLEGAFFLAYREEAHGSGVVEGPAKLRSR